MSSNQNHGWTDERKALLKKLWEDGVSADHTAKQLGGFGHCKDGGRSAVLGMMHRMRDKGEVFKRKASSNPGPRVRKVKSGGTIRREAASPSERRWNRTGTGAKNHPLPRRIPTPVPIDDIPVPVSLNLSLMALEDNQCHWPMGNAYCGHTVSPAGKRLRYCEYHLRHGHQASRPRRGYSITTYY